MTLVAARRWSRHGEEDRQCDGTGVDRSFDSSELVAACPVLHERVEICVALHFDDRVAQRLDGGLAALKFGDTELSRRPVINQICTIKQSVSQQLGTV